MRPSDLPPAAELAQRTGHGTRSSYVAGCRCAPCRKANSLYSYAREVARRNGDVRHVVSAERSRAHLEMLSRRGVGRRTIADVARCSMTTIHEIRKGRKLQLRADVEARILRVDPDLHKADHALVSDRSSRRLVRRLVDEGYTRQRIAEELGSAAAAPKLQLFRPSGLITVRNRAKLEAVYRRLMS